MTTMPATRPETRPRPAEEPRTGGSTPTPRCPGCPRCQDPAAPLCHLRHEKFANRHPLCKLCHHCVLRGKHADDASDLDDHPGFRPEQQIQIHAN